MISDQITLSPGTRCHRTTNPLFLGTVALERGLRHPGGHRCSQVQGLYPSSCLLQCGSPMSFDDETCRSGIRKEGAGTGGTRHLSAVLAKLGLAAEVTA